jgi:hypothetical protein
MKRWLVIARWRTAAVTLWASPPILNVASCGRRERHDGPVTSISFFSLVSVTEVDQGRHVDKSVADREEKDNLEANSVRSYALGPSPNALMASSSRSKTAELSLWRGVPV